MSRVNFETNGPWVGQKKLDQLLHRSYTEQCGSLNTGQEQSEQGELREVNWEQRGQLNQGPLLIFKMQNKGGRRELIVANALGSIAEMW